MNWVEKKSACERALADGAPDLWNKIRSAIQDSCESYNTLYGSVMENRATCELENGKRVRIEKQIRTINSPSSHRDDVMRIVVAFHADPPRVSVAGDGPVKSRDYPISSNETTAFIGSVERPFEPDELSKQIMEPLLFPTGNFRNIR